MESDERYIESCFGKKAPFTVPEGYFDHFADDFMARLDDQPAVVHHSWWHRYRYYVASASCLAGLLLTSTVYLAHTQHQQTKALAEQHAIVDASQTRDS